MSVSLATILSTQRNHFVSEITRCTFIKSHLMESFNIVQRFEVSNYIIYSFEIRITIIPLSVWIKLLLLFGLQTFWELSLETLLQVILMILPFLMMLLFL